MAEPVNAPGPAPQTALSPIPSSSSTFTSTSSTDTHTFTSSSPSTPSARLSRSRRALPKSLPIRKKARANSSTLSDPDPDADHALYETYHSPEDHTHEEPGPRPVSQATSHSRNHSDPCPSISGASTFAKTDYGWNHKSLSKRISWGWNQTFAGLSPTTLTEVTYQRAQPAQIIIQRRQTPSYRRPSIASSSASTETDSSEATSASSTIATPLSPADKPFAHLSGLKNKDSPSAIAAPATSLPILVEEAAREDPDTTDPLPPVDPQPAFDIQELIDDMGLARSLTKRLQRSDSSNSATRNLTTRKQRPQISLPLELITTTNDLTRTAPDIFTRPREGSDATPSTPETPELTDNSSIGSRSSSDSPTRERFSLTTPNHLTQYFASAENKSPTSVEVTAISTPSSSAENSPIPSRFSTASLPPSIPTRAPSHSKREHVRLARVRSVRTSGNFHASRHTSYEDSQTSSPDESHPFSRELAQLDEIREDFNSMILQDDVDAHADELWLESAGYKRFTPSAYCDDIQDLEASRFAE